MKNNKSKKRDYNSSDEFGKDKRKIKSTKEYSNDDIIENKSSDKNNKKKVTKCKIKYDNKNRKENLSSSDEDNSKEKKIKRIKEIN